MTRKRILHIITQLDRGGAETQLLTLCANLPQDRFQSRVVSLVRNGNLKPSFEAAGTSVRDLDRRDHGGPAGQLLALVREIRAWRPDILQTWLQKANHVGRLAAVLATRRPVIACFRDLGFQASWGDTLLDSILEYRTALTLHNSEAGRRVFLARVRGAQADRQHLLRNGIDSERFRPDPVARRELRREMELKPDDPVVVMVARLHPIKDPLLFLRTARRVLRSFPRARFWLVGGGPLEDELRRRLAASPAAGLWLGGERSDVPRLLAAADLAILTSRSEGLSNTILEAMSCGLPVLATDVGGNAELIQDGENGYLLRERDELAIAQVVERLLRSQNHREELGRAGRRLVEERYSLAKLVEQADSYYEHISQE